MYDTSVAVHVVAAIVILYRPVNGLLVAASAALAAVLTAGLIAASINRR